MVGSVDGTPLTEPIFIAASLRNAVIGNSSSLSPSSVLYWQFGWLGIIFGGVLLGYLVCFFSDLLINSSLTYKMLFIHLLFFTYGFYCDLTLFLQWVWQYFIPIYFSISLVRKVFFKKISHNYQNKNSQLPSTQVLMN